MHDPTGGIHSTTGPARSPDVSTRVDRDGDRESVTDLVESLCNEQVERWRAGDRVSVESFVARHPRLVSEDEALFELIYGEFLVRESLGEPPSAEEFAGRFPQFAERLGRQLDLHSALHDVDMGPESQLDEAFESTGLGFDSGLGINPLPRKSEPFPTIPGYDLLDELGRGAMGVVYRARHRALNRLVALKVIRPWLYSDPEVAARFRAEAETAARFQHPNIVQVHEVGEHEGQGYLALEYVAGGTLRERLAGSPRVPREAARLVENLALAVHYAHERGIVHRDLKPANVVLTEEGIPKVTDFGLAKLLTGDEGMTRVGDILGTPNYMAPEQALGSPDAVTPLTDVYALGAILYETLTGRPPFQGSTPFSVLDQVKNLEPLPPGKLERHTPSELETICLKCLEKEPRKRYGSALELAEDLRRFLEDRTILARRAGPLERLIRWGRREPMKAGLLAALALALIAGFAATAVLWRRAVHTANEARNHLYASQIARARLEWRLNDVGRAGIILDECEPSRRGWEWRYLQDLARPEVFHAELKSEYQYISAVAFSPEGSRLAFTGWDPFRKVPETQPAPIDVWDFREGRKIWSFEGFPLACRVSFSPDGRFLAASGHTSGLAVWNLNDGRKVHSWPSGGSLTFSPDGRFLASGESKAVLFRDAGTGAEVRRIASSGGRATFSPDGRLLAVSGPEAVEILDVATGQRTTSLPYGTGEDRARHDRMFHDEGPDLSFSPDGKRLVVATDPPKVWDLTTGRTEFALIGHEGRVMGVAFGPDGRKVATAGADTTVRLWDAKNGSELEILRGHLEIAGCLAFHPDGWALASGGRHSAEVKVWDLTRHPEYRRIPISSSQALHFGGGRKLLAIDTFGQILTHDSNAGTLRRGAILDVTSDWITPAVTADFSDDGSLVATIAHDRNVTKLYDVATGQETAALTRLPSPATMVDISADGSRVLAMGMKRIDLDPNRDIRVWDAKTGDVVADFRASRFPIRYIHGAAVLSPDGSRLAFDDYERPSGQGPGDPTVTRIRVKDLPSTKERFNVALQGQCRIIAMTFSPDGRFLAVADLGEIESHITVLDANSGAVVMRSPKQDLPSYRLSFNPDSRLLSAAERDKVSIWDVREGRELLVLRIASRRSSDGGYNPTVAWSPDGQTLANTNWDGSLTTWEAPSQPPTPSARLSEAHNRVFDWHLREAEAAFVENPEAAAFHLGRIRASNPLDIPSTIRAAHLYMRSRSWAEASECYRRWLASDEPDAGPAWRGAARAFLLTGDWNAYQQLHFRLLDTLSKTNSPLMLQNTPVPLTLGHVPGFDASGIVERARASFARNPADHEAHLALAIGLYRSGRHDEVLALALDPPAKTSTSVPIFRVLSALALEAKGRHDEARGTLAEVTASINETKKGRDDWPDLLILLNEATATILGEPSVRRTPGR